MLIVRAENILDWPLFAGKTEVAKIIVFLPYAGPTVSQKTVIGFRLTTALATGFQGRRPA
jgi:hypothetical protein